MQIANYLTQSVFVETVIFPIVHPHAMHTFSEISDGASFLVTHVWSQIFLPLSNLATFMRYRCFHLTPVDTREALVLSKVKLDGHNWSK